MDIDILAESLISGGATEKTVDESVIDPKRMGDNVALNSHLANTVKAFCEAVAAKCLAIATTGTSMNGKGQVVDRWWNDGEVFANVKTEADGIMLSIGVTVDGGTHFDDYRKKIEVTLRVQDSSGDEITKPLTLVFDYNDTVSSIASKVAPIAKKVIKGDVQGAREKAESVADAPCGTKDAATGRLVPTSKTMTEGAGNANAAYLNKTDLKDKILRAVAKHYGISTDAAEDELVDPDAEAVYEYIGNDPGLRMRVYNEYKTMSRKGLGEARLDEAAPSREVALTIANQLSGTDGDGPRGLAKLQAMLGIQTWWPYTWDAKTGAQKAGLTFKWPNRQRSKGNMVMITLTPADVYDVEFYNVAQFDSTLVKEYRGVYADALRDTFEKQTGWNTSL